MKKRKIVNAAVVGVLGLGAFLYLCYGYLYKQARDVAAEKPAFTAASQTLAADYRKDSRRADAQYLNKTMQVAGTVTEVRDSLLVLDAAVSCAMKAGSPDNIMGKQITLKGRCIGYDELFDEVKLDQCTLK